MESNKEIRVIYIRDDAFTKCECGKEMALHKFSNNTYEGSCTCGNSYKMREGKIWATTDK
jgi:hypothetical protein